MVVTFDFPTLDIRPITLSSHMSRILDPLKQLSTFASHHSDPQVSFLPFDFRLSTFGLLLFFSFLISNCGFDIEDPTPPSAPVWVQKSLPEEWPERGIDAHESGRIYLEWEFNPKDNISAYLIYRAKYFEVPDSTGDYDLLEHLETESLVDMGYLDTHSAIRTKYYYRLQAVDRSDNHSALSDPLTYSLLPQLPLFEMTPNGLSEELNPDRQLTWRYIHSIEMEDYCLTILTAENELVVRQVLIPRSYLGVVETWRIPVNIILKPNQIYKWRIDVGAKYVNQFETAGSESQWAPFFYAGD